MSTEHGTRTAYTTTNCRCDTCRAANADYQRARYQAREDVRDKVRAQQEHRRREAGVEPRPEPAAPELLALRRGLRERLTRIVESPEEKAARREARRVADAALAPEERERRLVLQRDRNATYRLRLSQR